MATKIGLCVVVWYVVIWPAIVHGQSFPPSGDSNFALSVDGQTVNFTFYSLGGPHWAGSDSLTNASPSGDGIDFTLGDGSNIDYQSETNSFVPGPGGTNGYHNMGGQDVTYSNESNAGLAEDAVSGGLSFNSIVGTIFNQPGVSLILGGAGIVFMLRMIGFFKQGSSARGGAIIADAPQALRGSVKASRKRIRDIDDHIEAVLADRDVDDQVSGWHGDVLRGLRRRGGGH